MKLIKYIKKLFRKEEIIKEKIEKFYIQNNSFTNIAGYYNRAWSEDNTKYYKRLEREKKLKRIFKDE